MLARGREHHKYVLRRKKDLTKQLQDAHSLDLAARTAEEVEETEEVAAATAAAIERSLWK